MIALSKIIYALALQLYAVAIHTASIFNPKAKAWVEGRKKNQYPTAASTKRIWFHAASLGEYEQVRPVIDELKAHYADKQFVITFFSPSGYEVTKMKHPDDEVLYLPLDTAPNAHFIVDYINPEIAVFVKYEHWYFTIHELYNRNIPVLLIAAYFKPGQIFFKSYGGFFRSILHCYCHIFVQDIASKHLLEKIGIGQVTICGDTRFDRVLKVASDNTGLETVTAFAQQSKIFIAGSTWQRDEDLMVHLINNNYKKYPHVKFIIAPHEINATHIEALQQQIIPASTRYSHLSVEDAQHYRVLIIDNVGMLSRLYRYATLAYVGGGFDHGIHNVLEPAVYGIPVLFGPKHERFKEAAELLEMKTAFSVKNIYELETLFDKCMDNEVLQLHCKKELATYFEESAGATREIAAYVYNILDDAAIR